MIDSTQKVNANFTKPIGCKETYFIILSSVNNLYGKPNDESC
jgi:hypothetical protein